MKRQMNRLAALLLATAGGFSTSVAQNALTPVKPLIGTNELSDREGYLPWNQYMSPYNDLTPKVDGKNSPVGCVALSMAMIMSAHQWPSHGMGEVSYQSNGMPLRANFSDHRYDWTQYMVRYQYADLTDAQRYFIATLLSDCGLSIHMNYGSLYTGSGAPEERAAQALYKNFSYDKSVSYLCRDYCTTKYWEELLRKEISEGRPVMYGAGSRNGAHEFTCDGYDAQGRFFFHMGGMELDGYYALKDIPGGYTTSQTIVYHIVPKGNTQRGATGEATMVAGSNRDFLADGNKLTAHIRFFTPIEAFNAEIAIAVKNKANGNVVKYLCQRDVTTSTEVNQSTTEYNFQFTDNSLGNGTYYLYPVYRKKNTGEWKEVLFGQFYQERVTLVVNGTIKTFQNNDLKEDIDEGKVKKDKIVYILDNSNNTASVSFQNSAFNSYSGDVKIPEKVTIDNKTYTVTSIGQEAFSKCTNLGNVTIPATVRSIGYGAFYACHGKSITFAAGSQLTTIEPYAFQNSGFPYIALPEGLTNIGSEAFVNCSTTDFVLPSTLSSIGEGIFKACNSIKNFTVNRRVPPVCSVKNDPFLYITNLSNINLYVPAGSRNVYIVGSEVFRRFTNIREGNAPAPGTTTETTENTTTTETEVIPGTYAIKLTGTNYYLSTDMTQGNYLGTCSLSDKAEYFHIQPANGGGYTITSSRNNKKIGYSSKLYGSYSPSDICEESLVWYLNLTATNTTILRKSSKLGIGVAEREYGSPIYTNQQNCTWTLVKAGEAKRNAKRIVVEEMADETTAIEEVVEQTPAAKQIFDLQGRRVASPIRGRIYVIGGKKVVY
ncbi:MAG: C10 family peptidase [Bacteroidales bacterium]|nr:C10 family peptidase [Candidatus Physcousia equi]